MHGRRGSRRISRCYRVSQSRSCTEKAESLAHHLLDREPGAPAGTPGCVDGQGGDEEQEELVIYSRVAVRSRVRAGDARGLGRLRGCASSRHESVDEHGGESAARLSASWPTLVHPLSSASPVVMAGPALSRVAANVQVSCQPLLGASYEVCTSVLLLIQLVADSDVS